MSSSIVYNLGMYYHYCCIVSAAGPRLRLLLHNSIILLMISSSSSHRLQPSTVGGIFRLTGAIVDDCRMDLDLQCYSLLNKTPVIIPHCPPPGLLVSGSVSKQELDEYQGMIMVPY